MSMGGLIKKIREKVRNCFRPSSGKVMTEEEVAIKKMKADYDYLIKHGVETEFGYVTLYGNPIIVKKEGSVIRMGKGVVLVSNSMTNTAGVNHPVIIATYSEKAEVVIGDNVGMSGTSINCVDSCVIEEGVKLGANVNVWDTDFHPLDPSSRANQRSILEAQSAPIVLEKNVWVGANTTILKGVTVGENTVVGTMSLVNKSLPANSICAGIPASKIKDLN